MRRLERPPGARSRAGDQLERLEREGVEARLDVGLGERLLHVGVDLVAHCRGQAARCDEHDEGVDLQAGRPARLGDGRHFGQLRDALRRGDRDVAQLAGLVTPWLDGIAGEAPADVAGADRGVELRDLAERHVLHLDAAHHLELLAAQVARAADAPGAVAQLAGAGLGRGDQVGHRLPLRVGRAPRRGRACGTAPPPARRSSACRSRATCRGRAARRGARCRAAAACSRPARRAWRRRSR